MIKDTTKISFIDCIHINNINDELEYHLKLKDGYYFTMTNTNSIHVFNILDLNKVLNYGVKWNIK